MERGLRVATIVERALIGPFPACMAPVPAAVPAVVGELRHEDGAPPSFRSLILSFQCVRYYCGRRNPTSLPVPQLAPSAMTIEGVTGMTRRKQRNPAASESRHYHELAKARIAGGVNSNVRLSGVPICFASGKGSRLTDVDGNVYIDYALGMGPTILGHAPAAVTAEVARTLALGQLFAGQHTLELELANELCACVKSAELVRFGLSGSEMVQAAIRVARAYTGRSEVIKFEGHYHGWFDNVLINQNPPVDTASNPIPRPRYLQSAGQSAHASEDFAVLPWNDTEAVDQYVGANASRIAAIITEPIMFNTGGILPKPGYLEHLRRVTKERDIVLIFDEVITGFRVALGGAQELYDIKPDLSVFAKALGAGFPWRPLPDAGTSWKCSPPAASITPAHTTPTW